MDNFASYNRPVLQGGELVVSLALRPQTPVALVATRDIGEFAAIAFGQPGGSRDGGWSSPETI